MEKINLYPEVEPKDVYAAMEGTKSEEIEISGQIRGEIKAEHSADSFYEKEETELMIEEHEVIEPDPDTDIKIDFHAVMESVKYEEMKIRDEEIKPIYTAPSVISETQEIPKSESGLPDEKCWLLLCRLCAMPCHNMIDIFGQTILHRSIMEKIQQCLPVTVQETDTLSKKVCGPCLQKLESYHEFHLTVIEAEKQLLVFCERRKDGLGEEMKIHHQTSDRKANNNDHNTELSIETSDFGETTASQSEQGVCFAALNSLIREVYVEKESKFDIGVSDTVNHTPPNTIGQSEPRLGTYPTSTKKCSYFLRKRKPMKYNTDNDVGLSCGEVIDGHAPAAQNIGRQFIKCHSCKAAVQTIEKCHSHARIHASTNYYPCCFCDEILETELKWKDHWSTHVVKTESRNLKRRALLYRCNECGEKFASKIRLQYHKLDHKCSNSHRKTCDKVLDLETSPQQRMMGVHNGRETSTGNVSGKQLRNNEKSNSHGKKHAFRCICCKKKLASIVMLEKHKKICFDNTKEYTCDYCKKIIQSISALRIHMSIHIGERPFSCDICPKSFTTKRSRDEHHNIHNGERPYSCDICPKSFTNKRPKDRHRRIHMGKRPFSCEICPKSFQDRRDRDEHHRIHTGERPFSCDICLKSFKNKRNRNEHSRIHHGDQSFSCDICPKSFKNKRNRDEHHRIHTGERPFSCDICPKAFATKRCRDEHHRMHTEERPFSCDICPKSFKYKRNRDGHRRIHTEAQPFSCDICPKSFKHKRNRDEHRRIHTEAQPFSCDICPKSFQYKRNRDGHRRIHTEEQPFSCDICPKSFKHKRNRDEHHSIHTGE